MKTLIASLLWFFVTTMVHPAPPPASFDARYLALMQWATELNEKANAWNEHCGTNVEGEGCTEVHAILGQQFAFFIVAAGSYHSEGDDCEAKMRQKFVSHTVRVFSYNMNCVAKSITDVAPLNCKVESAALDAETAELKKESDACLAENSKL